LLRSWIEPLVVSGAGVAVGIAGERALGWAAPGGWVPDLVTGWTLVAAGVLAWALRPPSLAGFLVAATGFAWFVPNLTPHLLYLHRGPLMQLVLTYPSGRPRRRWEAGVVAAGYGVALATPVWDSAAGTITVAALLTGVAAVAYSRGVGRERRERGYALIASCVLAAVLAVTAMAHALDTSRADAAAPHVYEATLCVLAVGAVIGLVRAPWERAAVTDLVVELGERRSATLRDALARALGDPSLEVGYWLDDRREFVDAGGRPLRLPADDDGRAATRVEHGGQPVAVLVHDPTVLDDPALVDAVSSAARLAAANARLQATLRARVDDVAAARRRVLIAGDEERARLARRLGEGAERRLDELGATLQEARTAANAPSTADRVAQVEQQLERARADVRRFGRGVHPALSEGGLAAALEALAAEFTLPVNLTVSPGDLPAAVERCVYFVCSEALTNVAKYASASAVSMSVSNDGDAAEVRVEDDGIGGADPARGTGLRGLADRVETLGGTLSVDSPVGGPTCLSVRLPLRA
jgi:signal transduction histidine kinase